ncbi:hypothetical protein [Chromobacterium paludis]|uniref:Uncharacterized protein n=1 Tax=Chromobacterium paludis TaxID=2605945 RepID=A0A5C1DG36_9NEIS|nr:hypothetical protein [Chromobacterium paludis]QEL55694.1 hypothetical protein FYK34_08995 [Chromobacterium paludis]
MEFQFNLEDPLQCLERIYQQLNPMVAAFRPMSTGGLFGPAFGSGLFVSYHGEVFIITSEAVLSELSVAYPQQAWACADGHNWPLRDLDCACSQHMEIGAIHLPAAWLDRQAQPHCFELAGGWADPLAAAFTLLLGYPVPSRQPMIEIESCIGLISRAYRGHIRGCSTLNPLFLEFDGNDILCRRRLEKTTLQHNYQLWGTPAITLHHDYQQGSNRLTAYLQGIVTEWDSAGIGAVATSTMLLCGFLDNLLRQLRQGKRPPPDDMAALLGRMRR